MKCSSCGSDQVVKAPVEVTRHFDDFTFVGEIPGRRCEACSETFTPALALEKFEQAIAGELATQGAHSPKAFKFMRKIAGFKSVELATLLGVEPETVSRWESGARPLDIKAAVVLGSLVLDALRGQSSTHERLEAMQRPHHEDQPMRIAI